MTFVIIIFFISVIGAFGMLAFRSWEIYTSRVVHTEQQASHLPPLWFRHIEKNMLYLTKYVVQHTVLAALKVWFITTTKLKKWIKARWPKAHKALHGQEKADSANPIKISFARRAVIESKSKIRKLKEKIREEHR